MAEVYIYLFLKFMFQFINFSEVFSEVEFRVNRGLSHQLWQTISSWTSLCTQGHCQGGTRENVNTTRYNDILDNCVLTTLWQQFRGRPTYGCDGQVHTNLWLYSVLWGDFTHQ